MPKIFIIIIFFLLSLILYISDSFIYPIEEVEITSTTSNYDTEKINDIIYSNLKENGGSVSAEHGIGLDKKKYLYTSRSSEEINLMKTLKKILDPKNILNPGRVIPD